MANLDRAIPTRGFLLFERRNSDRGRATHAVATKRWQFPTLGTWVDATSVAFDSWVKASTEGEMSVSYPSHALLFPTLVVGIHRRGTDQPIPTAHYWIEHVPIEIKERTLLVLRTTLARSPSSTWTAIPRHSSSSSSSFFFFVSFSVPQSSHDPPRRGNFFLLVPHAFSPVSPSSSPPPILLSFSVSFPFFSEHRGRSPARLTRTLISWLGTCFATTFACGGARAKHASGAHPRRN